MSHNRPADSFSIQALAKACGVSRSTILRLEDDGLITPAYKDPDSGYRYYDVENLAQVIRIINYQALGFSKKEISEFIKNPDILKKNINFLTERYNFILRELERLRILYANDENYIIRQQEYNGGYYLRLTRTMNYSPVNIWNFARNSLEYFMTLKLTGIPGKAMHITIDDADHIGFIDNEEHVTNLIIPINEHSYPGEDIIKLEPSRSLILSCNCTVDNTAPYYQALWDEAIRLGYRPKGNIRMICFPEIVSYSKSSDHIYPLMLAVLVD